jgi:hypothetical protein
MTEKVKLSEIRAKFPMYADLNDEQLLIGLRKKFYSDIPMAQFAQRIEYDTGEKPTDGMSTTELALAGAGKAVADLGRGAGQWLGVVSRDDVAESRKRDKALMGTGAGLAGNIAGNVAAVLPTAFIPGANTLAGAGAIGAVTGAMAPSESTGETLKNIGVGGALAPASILAGRGVGAAWSGGKGLFEPLTKAGQERIAARTLQSFAQNPARAAANLKSAKPLVPGSVPTLAQAADDPGLAQLERSLANNPEAGPQLAARAAEQRAARMGAIKDIAGTDEHYNAIKEGRSIFAKEDYAEAMTKGIDPDAAKVLKPQIDSLMRRPSIQQARQEAMKLAQESDRTLTDFGSIEGLDWLKKGLDNIVTKAKAPGSSIGDVKLRALEQTRRDLMEVLEGVAPGYKKANDNFAAMSRQVNSMDVARDLLKKYEPALARYGANTRETANSYAGALESAIESTKKSTGMDLPLSRFMPKNDFDTLENIAKDMARKAKAEDMGRAVGSNTAQNLASQNLLRRTLGPLGLPEKWGESTALQTLVSPVGGLYRLGGAEQRILDRLAQAGLDPADAARLLAMPAKQREAALKRVQALLPVTPLGGLLSVPAEQ